MEAPYLVILFLCTIATSALSAVTGMAGGIVLLSLMGLFLAPHLVIPLHGMVQLASNSSRAFGLFRFGAWSLLWPYILGLPVGVVASMALVQRLPQKEYILFFIAGLIFFQLFKPKKLKGLEIPAYGFFFVGFGSGLLSLLVGATGPFLAPFFLRSDLSKKQIIASKSLAQTLTHLLKIPAFLSLGFPYQEHLILLSALILAAFLGTFVGLRWLTRINEELFLKIFRGVLFLIACRLLYQASLVLR